MFEKASIKLAGLYLGIIMVISIAFSISIYQLSMSEFDRGFRGSGSILSNGLSILTGDFDHEMLREEQERRFQEAQDRVLSRLILINVVILVGGGFLSYYLARKTLQPIEEAHDAQSRFTADASHELRTPIAAMQSEIEVALMDPKLTLKEAKEKLHSNLEELAKLTALSTGLLKLAQFDNTTLNSSRFRIDQTISSAISRVSSTASKKNILLKKELSSGLNVQGDEASLVEAFVILLDNAVKYSPEKTEILIAGKKEQSKVVVRVTDQGIGIKASELSHIFERFYRADAARSKKHIDGYGLGLAIAKNIIDIHHGTVSVQSKPTQGSTFIVSLPLSHSKEKLAKIV